MVIRGTLQHVSCYSDREIPTGMEIPMTLYCFVQNLDKASDDDDDN